MLQFHMIAVHNGVAGKIPFLLVGVALEASSHAQQVGRAHAIRERILTRTKHLAIDRNLRRIGLITSKDADGVEWLQDRSSSALFEHVTQVETDHRWREVGRMQPHDLRAVRRFGQEIIEGTNEIRYLSAFVEGILAWPEDMALQIYGAIAERQNRRD